MPSLPHWLDRINNANPIRKFERWRTSRVELLRQIDRLRKENERLKQKVAALQQAKDQAEKHAEDRRREKEALRAKLSSQKKAFESTEQQVGQLAAKITELRAENDKLKRTKKK
jgi:chromosome segregation ATPase